MSEGIYTLTSERVNDSYYNYSLGISAHPQCFDKKYKDYENEAGVVYNDNIGIHGKWLHGRGVLGE